MRNLKQKVIRGGFAKVCAQGATFALRMGSLMVLARLLDPKDFGLVGMVTAFTGVLNLFRDFGLSTATVQRDHVTDDQVSTLFWINIFVGVVLAFILIGLAPFVAIFYHEPRLVWVSVILATSFIFNGAGVQHTALLERQVRFTALAAIDIISLVLSMGIGIGMAASGLGYWALVASAVTYPLISTFCLWFTTDWRPGKVHFQKEVHSMLRFGGAFTLISVIVYTVYNLEKVLVGRYWGAAALGLYSRGYQLINLPTENLTFAFGGSETASFMGEEIKNARRTIPLALLFGGLTVAFCYIIGTVCVLLALPSSEVSSLQGLVEAIAKTSDRVGLPFFLPVAAFLIALSNIGASGAYLAAVARLPFVAGIDRYLPLSFGALHPRWGTPWVALLTQAVIGAIFIFLGQAGTSVKGAYDVLVSMGVITYFIPYLYLFASMFKLQSEPVAEGVIRVPGGKPAAYALAIVGFITTTFTIALSVLPPPDEPNKPLAVFKIVGGCGALVLIGVGLYWAGKRRAAKAT